MRCGPVLLSGVIGIAAVATGCHRTNCLDYALSALSVRVVDATGEDVCDARVVATEGNYVEQLTAAPHEHGGCGYSGARERGGHYTVTATWNSTAQQSDIEVGSDDCHVIPERVTLELQP